MSKLLIIMGIFWSMFTYGVVQKPIDAKSYVNEADNTEYVNLKKQLTQHLISIGTAVSDEYISQYLKRIGTPVALRLLDDLIKMDKYLARGIELMSSNKNLEAIYFFNLGIELDYKSHVFWDRRGTAHYSLKDYEQAIYDYTKAISFAPAGCLAFYYMERALAYLQLGNINAMINDFEVAAKLGYLDAQAILQVLRTQDNNIKSYQQNDDIYAVMAQRFAGKNSTEFEQMLRAWGRSF